MSVEPIVPTYILQSDGLFREGLRLMLSKTRFRPQACVDGPDELKRIPSDDTVLFIVGIEQEQDSVCKRIRAKFPRSFIVAIGDEAHLEKLRAALDNGANAALLGSVSPPTLVSALNSVISGPLVVMDHRLGWFDTRLVDDEPQASIQQESPLLLDAPPMSVASRWAGGSDPQPPETLSSREIAILERIVRGDSNKHVARFYNIAEPTVKAHVKAIFRKIGASNRTQAAIWAINHGLTDATNNAFNPLSLSLQPGTNGEDALQVSTWSAFRARILKRAVS